MSWSLSELKHKNTGLSVFDLENDTISSHYLFDENESFIEHFDYGCDYEIHENYELVHSVNSDFKFTQEQWNDLFRRLIEKTQKISKELYV